MFPTVRNSVLTVDSLMNLSSMESYLSTAFSRIVFQFGYWHIGLTISKPVSVAKWVCYSSVNGMFYSSKFSRNIKYYIVKTGTNQYFCLVLEREKKI